jgi:hypothetical protein
VFKGDLDSSNFASAAALTIYNGAATGGSCTTTDNPSPTSYGFFPSSYFAGVYTSQGLMGGYNIQLSDWTGGSWTSNASSPSSLAFTLFPNGNYTVAAADEWGQVVLLHFGVVRPSPAASVYQVAFEQIPCAGYYAVPWSVTLSSETIVMPANATVPVTGSAELQADPGASTITFTVPPGSYLYDVQPTAGFLHPDNTIGTIAVVNANTAVQVAAECHP